MVLEETKSALPAITRSQLKTSGPDSLFQIQHQYLPRGQEKNYFNAIKNSASDLCKPYQQL